MSEEIKPSVHNILRARDTNSIAVKNLPMAVNKDKPQYVQNVTKLHSLTVMFFRYLYRAMSVSVAGNTWFMVVCSELLLSTDLHVSLNVYSIQSSI